MSHPLNGCYLSAQLPNEKLVVVLRFRDNMPVPQNPAVLFQATLDPAKISKSGHLIRFDSPGDEVIGWQYRDRIEVVEVLGKLNEDGKTGTAWVNENHERAA